MTKKLLVILSAFCCLFVSCKEDKDGGMTLIKWEVISCDNLDYKYEKNNELKIKATQPGNVHVMSITPTLVTFGRIIIDGNNVEIEDPDFWENYSAVYEDEYIKIQLNQEKPKDYLKETKRADLTVFVKSTEKKVNYDISLDGYPWYGYGIITIDIQ